jgi:hypothetical protein
LLEEVAHVVLKPGVGVQVDVLLGSVASRFTSGDAKHTALKVVRMSVVYILNGYVRRCSIAARYLDVTSLMDVRVMCLY